MLHTVAVPVFKTRYVETLQTKYFQSKIYSCVWHLQPASIFEKFNVACKGDNLTKIVSHDRLLFRLNNNSKCTATAVQQQFSMFFIDAKVHGFELCFEI